MTYIYCLICPITHKIRYIGKANNPQRRAKDHMLDIRDMPTDKALWVGEMRKHKLKPILEILDEVVIEQWQFWEEFYIGYFKSLGIELLNKRAGNGLTFKNHQTFKKGQVPHNKNKIKMGKHYV